MDKIIKTLTLLFFMSGIGLFVAYSSGCFAVRQMNKYNRQLAKSEISQRESLSTVETATIQTEIDSLEEVQKIMMYSSKTMYRADEIRRPEPIDKRLSLLRDVLEQRGNLPDTTTTIWHMSNSDKDSNMHLGSSKVGLIQAPRNVFIKQKKPLDSLELLTVDMNVIEAEIDSLKQHKFRMHSSKFLVIDAEKEHAAIDKRLQLLENILNQRQ